MSAKSFKAEYKMLDLYKSLYNSKYGSVPVINKYKEKWAMSSLIEDFGLDEVSDCIEYYFRTDKDGHPISWFFFNFTQLRENLKSQRLDEELRRERREHTKRLAKEYMNGV